MRHKTKRSEGYLIVPVFEGRFRWAVEPIENPGDVRPIFPTLARAKKWIRENKLSSISVPPTV